MCDRVYGHIYIQSRKQYRYETRKLIASGIVVVVVVVVVRTVSRLGRN